MRTISFGVARLAVAVLGLGALGLAAPASAQSPPKGFDTKTLGTIDLGPEIDGMKGRTLRMSITTVAPGAVMPAHPHVDRPEIIYVLEGTVTETRDGKAVEYGPGSAIVMTRGVVHAIENKGPVPAVYVAAPIVKQP
jgi:quercetin dioxygenase-like cupin family protein